MHYKKMCFTIYAIPAHAPAPKHLHLTANDHIWWTTMPGKKPQQSGKEKRKIKKVRWPRELNALQIEKTPAN